MEQPVTKLKRFVCKMLGHRMIIVELHHVCDDTYRIVSKCERCGHLDTTWLKLHH